MTRIIAACDRLLCRVESAAMGIAFAAFVFMVLVTAVDVVLRYVFSRPLSWDYPVVTNYVVIALYCMAVAAAQRMHSNIGIELALRRLPPRLRAAVGCLTALVAIGFCLLIVATGFDLFVTAWIDDEVVPGVVSWPRWPSYLLFPLGFGLLVLRLLLQAVSAGLAAAGVIPVPALPQADMPAFE